MKKGLYLDPMSANNSPTPSKGKVNASPEVLAYKISRNEKTADLLKNANENYKDLMNLDRELIIKNKL